MTRNIVPVLNIREITEKAEIILDVSVSVTEDNLRIAVFNAGYAVINLKSGHCACYTGVSFLTDDDAKQFNDNVTERVKELCNFMREERGYNQV